MRHLNYISHIDLGQQAKKRCNRNVLETEKERFFYTINQSFCLVEGEGDLEPMVYNTNQTSLVTNNFSNYQKNCLFERSQFQIHVLNTGIRIESASINLHFNKKCLSQTKLGNKKAPNKSMLDASLSSGGQT